MRNNKQEFPGLMNHEERIAQTLQRITEKFSNCSPDDTRQILEIAAEEYPKLKSLVGQEEAQRLIREIKK